MYNRKQEEAILVGLFTHRLGETNKVDTVRVIEGGRVRLVDFDNDEVKHNELMDDVQYENMVDRVLKHRRDAGDKGREETADKVSSASDGTSRPHGRVN